MSGQQFNELTQLQIVDALSREFTNVFLINPKTATSRAIKLQNKIGIWLNIDDQMEHPYYEAVETYMKLRVHPDDRARMLDAVKLDRVLAELSDKDEYSGTYRIVDGEDIHYYQFKYIRIDGTDTIIEGYQNIDALVEADAKRRKADERQRQFLKDALIAAERSSNAKTTFLSNMSHDIRTPMNAIIGFTDLALRNLNDTDRVKDYLEKISISGEHLMALINDVLDMSRIESGNVSLMLKHVNLLELLGETETIIRANADEKHQILIVNTSRISSADVVTDQLRLNQIFLNILGNAVKFTPEGGTISLTAIEHPAKIKGTAEFEFHIADTGIGMSKEFQKHIFEPFTREQTSTVSGIQGTGLGMAITRNIVELLGGKITVRSEAGKGSEFIVSFTFDKYLEERESDATDDQPHLTVKLPSQEYPELRGRRLLLVEDNAMNQEIAKTLLTRNGFEVEIAEDGTVAVERMEKAVSGQYDLILMDIQMPKMNGYEATKLIRKLPREEIAETPIIALSANAFEEDKKAAYQVGMNGYVTKPIRIPKLMKQIAEILNGERRKE